MNSRALLVILNVLYALIIYLCITELKINNMLFAISLSAWMLLPLFLVDIIAYMRKARANISLVLLVILSLNTYVFFEVFYIHPDPQSGIAVLTLPIVDLVVGAMVLIIMRFNKRGKTNDK